MMRITYGQAHRRERVRYDAASQKLIEGLPLLLRCSLLLPLAIAVASAQSEAPRLEDVLEAAGAYVAGYERTLALVAEEEYSQQVTMDRRMLHSDILFIRDETFGWVEFRDVAARDGKPVRDREERLLALFTEPNSDRLKQASGS
jgi:hypothetical protein